MVIYAIEHRLSGRRYIGRTAQSLSMRWKQHRSELKRGCHPSVLLQHAWQTDGEQAFECFAIETVLDQSKAFAAERELWHLSRTVNPYNQSVGTLSGPVPGKFKHSAEAKEKCRLAHLGRKASEETRRRISEARAGRSYTRKRGYTLSLETRQKMSLARTGKKGSPESRVKRSATLKGRVFSQEWKDKIRAAKIGKPWSQARREAFIAAKLVETTHAA